MKKLFFFTILLTLISFSMDTQELTRQVSSKSGRSTFIVPESWYCSSNTSYFFTLFHPYESLIIADSKQSADMISEEYFISAITLDEDFTGALVVHTVLSSYIHNQLGSAQGAMDPDEIMKILMEPGSTELQMQKNMDDKDGFNAVSYQTKRNNRVLEVRLVFDKHDNILITCASFTQQYERTVEAIKNSLLYRSYSQEELYNNRAVSIPVQIFKHIMEIDIPQGWWLMRSPSGMIVAAPDVTYFFDIQSGTAKNPWGMFLTNSVVEDKNGTFASLLKQDTISDALLLSVLKEIGYDTARLTIHTIEKWQSEKKVSGICVTGKTTKEKMSHDISVKLFLIEKDNIVYMILWMMDELGKPLYLPIIDAVSATTRWVEK